MSSPTLNMNVVVELIQEVGPTLVAVLSGTRDRQLALLWKDRKAVPSAQEFENIRFGLEQFRKVAAVHGTDLARAWFIGENTQGFAPYFAIRLGLLQEVETSASRYAGEGR